MLFSMVSVPKLARDPKLLSFYEAFGYCLGDSIATFLLVSVIASLVNESVSSLDRLISRFGTFILWNLPAT